jgi:hypothetical protein
MCSSCMQLCLQSARFVGAQRVLIGSCCTP